VCLKIGYSNLYQNIPIFHGLSSFFPIKTCNQLGQRSHLQTLPNIYDLPWRMFCSTGLGRSAAAGAVAGRVGTGTPATYRTLVAAERRGSGRNCLHCFGKQRRGVRIYTYMYLQLCAVHIHRYVIIRVYRHIYIHTHTYIYIHIYKHIQTFPIQESQSLLGTTSWTSRLVTHSFALWTGGATECPSPTFPVAADGCKAHFQANDLKKVGFPSHHVPCCRAAGLWYRCQSSSTSKYASKTLTVITHLVILCWSHVTCFGWIQ
jgi:hypothetical protein